MNLNNKSILVVGGSGTLINSGLGNKIDQFDIVIRVNNAQTINGYEHDVGSKFDIWVTYSFEYKNKLPMYYFTNMYKGYGFTTDDLIDYLKQVKELWIASWNIGNLINDWKNDEMLKKYNLTDRLQRLESTSAANRCKNDLGSEQSTGFNTIWCLSQVLDKFYIVGFDSFGAMDVGNKILHYYDSRTIEDWKGEGIHTESKEAKYIKKLINDNRIKMLNENTKIQTSTVIRPVTKIICSKCGRHNNKYTWENKDICNYCKQEL